MNLRNLLTLIIISAGVMCGSAQTISTKHAHRAAHQQQLANAKLRMDKNVIQDFIKNDIGRREDAVANPDKLSSESAAMINDLLSEAGRNRNRGVGHVGIVVSADNDKGTFKFIHASTSQGIKVDSSDGYYTHRYLGARRLITE